MFGKALEVSGLTIDVSILDDVSIIAHQVSPVTVTCVMNGGNVHQVFADEGIEFLLDGDLVEVSYKPGAEITAIVDRKAFAKKIRAKEEENEAMQLHTKGE